MSRLAEAARLFERAHREDPRPGPDGRPRSVGYHERLLHWLLKRDPAPSEALLIAARCQHIRRWTVPRDRFPADRAGYKRWRSELARMHADQAEEILHAVGCEPAIIDRVRALLMKKGLGSDQEVQRFEDAICLVFLEQELSDFAARHDDDKLVAILRKTWKKMSPAGHALARELARRLPERAQELILRAVSSQADGP